MRQTKSNCRNHYIHLVSVFDKTFTTIKINPAILQYHGAIKESKINISNASQDVTVLKRIGIDRKSVYLLIISR